MFSHGFEGKLSLGYDYSPDYNTKLDFTTNGIGNIHANAFDNPVSWFYSCKIGTGGNSSFAQAWVSRVGGTTWAYKGKTTYEYIVFPREYPRGYTLANLIRKAGLGKWAGYDEAIEMLRKSFGFSVAGSIRYPEAANGATLLKFTR